MALKLLLKPAKTFDSPNMTAAVRDMAVRILRSGRQVLENVLQKGETAVKTTPKPHSDVAQIGRSLRSSQPTRSKNDIFSKLVPTRAMQNTLAAELRRRAAFQFQESATIAGRSFGQRLGRRLPIYAFVALGMSSKVSSEEDVMGPEWDKGFYNVCQEIRTVFSAKTAAVDSEVTEELAQTLESFEFGPLIAKGCNSAVYNIRLAEKQNMEVANENTCSSLESDITVIPEEDSFEDPTFACFEAPSECSFEVISSEDDLCSLSSDITVITESEDEVHEAGPGSDIQEEESYQLAVKMMFNYDAESRCDVIMRTMKSELVPANLANLNGDMDIWQNGNHVRKKRLPPHPNIVSILGVFVDSMPCLSDALLEYPDALPSRLNPDGFGRNKTLFIVMEKCDYTLREFVQAGQPSLDESLCLLAQAAEALVHLNVHQVAHRDIKSDNILLKAEADGHHLVLTDFGCCLAEEGVGLVVPYFTDETNKGGNGSLMAPEIATATAGYKKYLDYRSSDLWAIGAVAYEMFGANNPFYRDAEGNHLDNRMYIEDDLPPLPDHVPVLVERLIKSMLRKDPTQRPDVTTVANCLQLMLWAPAEWFDNLTLGGAMPSRLDVMRWLVVFSALTLCHAPGGKSGSVQQTLKSKFLSRLDLSEIMQAVDFLWSLE